MDNVIWVVIAAVVVRALAGILIFVAEGGLADFDDRTNETTNSQLCDFQASEVEAGRLDCSNIDSRCEGYIQENIGRCG